MRRIAALLAPALVAGNLACDPDNCADLPASFHLDIELEDKDPPTNISLLRVDLEHGDLRVRRYFETGDAFSDDKTSIGVELDPAPTEEIEDLRITVAAYVTTSTRTPPAAEKTEEVELEPNGCNRYRFELDV